MVSLKLGLGVRLRLFLRSLADFAEQGPGSVLLPLEVVVRVRSDVALALFISDHELLGFQLVDQHAGRGLLRLQVLSVILGVTLGELVRDVLLALRDALVDDPGLDGSFVCVSQSAFVFSLSDLVDAHQFLTCLLANRRNLGLVSVLIRHL